MNRIRLLPEQVANQIAAGEVVERPASVVKELVENALDAQASRITVETEAGGRSLIRVTDDGWGMSRDDALLCLERHATSKVRLAEDLLAISTMGFRGEALPSLASVCRFTLTTREADPSVAAASEIVIHGGKIVTVREAGAPVGTRIEARQLFFNLPARRKFLRSEETERGHIQHYLTLAALAHPHVAFTLIQDGRVIWQLGPCVSAGQDPPLDALRERLRILHGGVEDLIPVDYGGALGDAPGDSAEEVLSAPRLRVWGWIGAPGISRATRDQQHTFVNRRPIENRGLNFALLEGYHTALMKGRYPVACLFLELPPAEVDVNIHPTKREVKFRRENGVRNHVAQAVRTALREFHGRAAGDGSRQPAPGQGTGFGIVPVDGLRLRLATPHATAASPGAPSIPTVPPASSTPSIPALAPETFQPALILPIDNSGTVSGRVGWAPVPPALPATPPVAAGTQGSEDAPPAAEAEPGRGGAGAGPLLAVPLRLVGVVGNLYVVFESDRGLVLLDQHAAHERILFEQMLSRLESETAPSQRLLLPETIELPPADAQFLREQLAALNRLGVGLSEFGERTFLLDAIPPLARVADARRFVRDLIDELKQAGSDVNALRLGEHTVAQTVCRHAVKAHDPLTPAELENLVADLRRCAMPYTCPHGRPTLVELSYREIEKKFGRVA